MVWWIFVYSNSLKNCYVITQRRDNKEKKLNVCINMKTINRKILWLKTLVNSEYIYTYIDKHLVKEE